MSEQVSAARGCGGARGGCRGRREGRRLRQPPTQPVRRPRRRAQAEAAAAAARKNAEAAAGRGVLLRLLGVVQLAQLWSGGDQPREQTRRGRVQHRQQHGAQHARALAAAPAGKGTSVADPAEGGDGVGAPAPEIPRETPAAEKEAKKESRVARTRRVQGVSNLRSCRPRRGVRRGREQRGVAAVLGREGRGGVAQGDGFAAAGQGQRGKGRIEIFFLLPRRKIFHWRKKNTNSYLPRAAPAQGHHRACRHDQCEGDVHK